MAKGQNRKPQASTAVAVRTAAAVGILAELADQAQGFARASSAPATLRAYASDWRDFTAWCLRHRLATLPATPATLALYLADLAQRAKVSTIGRRVSAIAKAHRLAAHPSPTVEANVREVLAGIRRKLGTAKRCKTALPVEDLRAMVRALPAGLIGTRDRALLLLGFAGALRRSELVGLDLGDVRTTREGLEVSIRRSKTDQDGEGQRIGIPRGEHGYTCPVRAFAAWTEAAGIAEGKVFRSVTRHGVVNGTMSDRAVALVVKRAARRVGVEASELAGHSLRAGLVTAAAAAGVAERSIMNQTRHRSIAVMRSYIRDASIFRDNAAAAVGL